MLKRLHEEALDMVRLKALRLGALHLQTKFLHLGFGHGVVGERTPLQQLQQMILIDSSVDLAEEARLHVFLLAVLDRLKQ